jgi:hypothetical protein
VGQSCAASTDCCPGFICLSGACIFEGSAPTTQVVLLDNGTLQPFVSFGPVPQGTTVTANVIAQATAVPANAAAAPAATLQGPPVLEEPGGSQGFTVTPTDSSWNPAPWPATITPGSIAASTAYFTVSYTAPSNGNASAVVVVDYTVGAANAVQVTNLPVSADVQGSTGGCQLAVFDTATLQPSVSFGTVAEGQTASASVTLSSTGTQACQVSNLGIGANDQFNEFGLQGAPSTPANLPPGQTIAFTVTFTPQNGTAPLLRSANLQVVYSGSPGNPPITSVTPLSGTVGAGGGSSVDAG